MRITLVLPEFNLSGGIRVLAAYAERLRRRGHQVLAVAPRPEVPTFLQAVKGLLRGRGLPGRPGTHPSHFDALEVECRRFDHAGPLTEADVPDADVIVASWWETAVWVAALPERKGVKVHFVQGYETFGGTPEQIDAAYALPLPKIAVSEWLRGILETKFRQSPVAVIPNSVDTDQFFAPPRGKQPVPTVGLLYHTLPLKGYDLSRAACERAARALPGLRVVAVGEMAVTPELPLPPSTEFLRQARGQQLRDAYGQCDAWLFASRAEGFGLPILEAMACRTPVIATPAGAARELLGKGGGVLVPHEDPDAMARAVVRVCTLTAADWRALSDAALATATAYTWEDATHLLEGALTRLVGRPRG